MEAEAMTDEHGLLDAARTGGQGAVARLAGPYLARPRACCHRMLGPSSGAGHGAMDFGAGPDQYHQSSRSSQPKGNSRVARTAIPPTEVAPGALVGGKVLRRSKNR